MSADRYSVGVGLKNPHVAHVLATRPDIGFFEVHAENYMMADAAACRRQLDAIAAQYRLSLHGVGMSLGSAEGLDAAHLARFRALVDAYQPWLISEHLAWSSANGVYLNDLLPLPLNRESLEVVSSNVARMQDAIGRQILVENPASYMAFTGSTMSETAFLRALAERTGCGLLLDVNNVYVSARNLEDDAGAYIDEVSGAPIGEIHLAGHRVRDVDGVALHIDDHGSPVCDAVWSLYTRLIARIGPRPTLIEWDNNVPPFEVLAAQAQQAKGILRAQRPLTAGARAHA